MNTVFLALLIALSVNPNTPSSDFGHNELVTVSPDSLAMAHQMISTAPAETANNGWSCATHDLGGVLTNHVAVTIKGEHLSYILIGYRCYVMKHNTIEKAIAFAKKMHKQQYTCR